MATSTFLQLTNKVLERINEVPLTSSNFSSATGIHAFCKQAVNDAIAEIQTSEFEWPFNIADGGDTCVAGTKEYALPTALRAIDKDTFFITRDTALDIEGIWLRELPYEEWVRFYRSDDEAIAADIVANGTKSVPSFVVFTPDDNYILSPPPGAAYTTAFKYWTVTSPLSAYGDQTTIPERFDNIIVDGAMVRVNLFKDNAEASKKVEDTFNMGVKNMRSQLINTYKQIHDRRVHRR